MKRVVWLILALLLFSSIAVGCAQPAPATEPPQEEEAAEAEEEMAEETSAEEEMAEEEPATEEAAEEGEPARIVMIRVTGDPFYKTVECGALEEAARLGVDLEVQGLANFEIAEQTRVIDAVLATSPDAIILAPVDPTGVVPAIEKINEAGIPVITFDTRLDDPSIVDAEVITDNYEQGVLAADALAGAIGEEGKVFVLSDMPGIATTGEEQRGFEDRIAEYPNIEYLGTQFHNNDQNAGVSITKSIITANPDLAGIFATNTFGSQAVATALRELDMVGDVKVIAYDTSEEIIQGLKDGVFEAVLAYEARKEGVLSVSAAAALVRGEDVDVLNMVGNRVLTVDNVDDPENMELRYVDTCE
jgi:ribose transport system substrate-binding protein